MDDQPTPEQVPDPNVWPMAPARQGVVYGIADPNHGGQQMVAMTIETWQSFCQQLDTVTKQFAAAVRKNESRIILPNG